MFVTVFAWFIATLIPILVVAYILFLATRFVTAVEMIARRVGPR